MARYRKIDVRLWIDTRFRKFSKPQPNAQTLWIYLLTNPDTVNIPGLYRAGEAGMSEALGWPVKGFREAFQEVSQEGMAKADWEARVVWVPKAISYNPPQSPNVVKSWGPYWDEIPECELKDEAYESLKAFLKGMGEGFAEAFAKACSKPSGKVCPNQDQDQDQDQEQEKKEKENSCNDASLVAAKDAGATLLPAGPDPPKKALLSILPGKPKAGGTNKSPPAKTEPVWAAYSEEYVWRYHVKPTRNAKVNGQLMLFLARVPIAEAPDIARFYVRHPEKFYVLKQHPVWILLRDAEGLRTQWQAQIKITSSNIAALDKQSQILSVAKAFAAKGGGNGHPQYGADAAGPDSEATHGVPATDGHYAHD